MLLERTVLTGLLSAQSSTNLQVLKNALSAIGDSVTAVCLYTLSNGATRCAKQNHGDARK